MPEQQSLSSVWKIPRMGNKNDNRRLRKALYRGNLEDFKGLVETARGGDPQHLHSPAIPGSLDEMRPLALAASYGMTEIVNYILENGGQDLEVDHKDRYGCTALYRACSSCGARNDNHNLPIVKALLEHGANPMVVNNESGWTPLLWATINGHYGIVAALLNQTTSRRRRRRGSSSSSNSSIASSTKHAQYRND